MECPTKSQRFNRMEVDVVIEMQSVGRKENHKFNVTSNPPMIDRSDDDYEKSLDAIETTPFVDEKDSIHRAEDSIEKNSKDHQTSTEERGVKKAICEPLNWVFANNDMKRNYNLIDDSSVIEFIPEKKKLG